MLRLAFNAAEYLVPVVGTSPIMQILAQAVPIQYNSLTCVYVKVPMTERDSTAVVTAIPPRLIDPEVPLDKKLTYVLLNLFSPQFAVDDAQFSNALEAVVAMSRAIPVYSSALNKTFVEDTANNKLRSKLLSVSFLPPEAAAQIAMS